jgi:hypothetical protein
MSQINELKRYFMAQAVLMDSTISSDAVTHWTLVIDGRKVEVENALVGFDIAANSPRDAKRQARRRLAGSVLKSLEVIEQMKKDHNG